MQKTLATALAVVCATWALAVTPAQESFLLSVGRGQGSCVTVGAQQVCAQWRTTVWIHNPSATQSATVDIFFLERKVNTSPTSRRVTVAPGEAREFTDIFKDTFGFAESDVKFGALRFLADREVAVSGRIFDANVTVVGKESLGAGGAGQFFAGMPRALALGNGGATNIVGLAQSTNYRSNFFVLETTGNSVTFEVKRLDGNGNELGTFSDTIGAFEARQYNEVLRTRFNTTNATNQRLKVTVTSGPGALLAGASIIDNRSGDPSTLAMETAGGVAPTTGVFEGVIRDTSGVYVNGGIALAIGGTGITSVTGSSNITCQDFYTSLDFNKGFGSSPIVIQPNGSFTTTYTIDDYQDPISGQKVLTVVWTINGQRNPTGVFSGTISSQVTAASGDYVSCLNANDQSSWRAAWVAAN